MATGTSGLQESQKTRSRSLELQVNSNTCKLGTAQRGSRSSIASSREGIKKRWARLPPGVLVS